MFKRTKSKEWSKCYRSFMKTKQFILHLFLGTLFINLAVLSLRINNDIIAFMLFGINMSLSFYFGSKKMFDKLEIHMNKSGFTLETKSGELEYGEKIMFTEDKIKYRLSDLANERAKYIVEIDYTGIDVREIEHNEVKELEKENSKLREENILLMKRNSKLKKIIDERS